MKKIVSVLFAMVGTIALAHNVNAQGHYHMFVAADGKNQGDALRFDDIDGVETENGFVSTFTFAETGKYAGYYQGNLTASVLSLNETNSAYSPNAPAAGSWVFVQLATLDGPEGGAFGLWETDAIAPTISLDVGATGTNGWLLGENDGSPNTDPYGHIHGRRYTATKPGLYTVGFRAVDFSTNGTGGGPIHTPSEVFHVYFQAGITIASVSHSNATTSVSVGGTGGLIFSLQFKDSPGSTNDWQQAGGILVGDDHFLTLTDLVATNETKIYRVRADEVFSE